MGTSSAGRDSLSRRSKPPQEWVLGRRSGPFEVEGPTHYRPDLVLLVEAASDEQIAEALR